MHDGWRDTTLAEIASLDCDRTSVDPTTEYQIAGVLNAGQGVFRREAILGAETNYPILHRLHEGQLVMRKLTAFEGAITCVPAEFDGWFVSTEFPTFALDRRQVDPRYMRLVCQWPPLWEQMWLRSTGTVQRRKRVNPSQLLQVGIPLPSLASQERIVDLVAAVDLVATLAAEEGYRSRAAWAALVAEPVMSGEFVALSEVVIKAKAGSTPSRRTPANFVGTIPWLKSGEVDDDSIATTRESISQQALKSSSAWLMPPGTIVIAMYGQGDTAGTVGQLAAEMACNQAVLGLVPDESRIDGRFLYHWLRSRKAGMRARRVGTTQPNLNKAIVLQEAVPVVPLDQQRRIAGALDAAIDAERRAANLAAAIRRARAAILADLLAGRHEIPDSYDALLEKVS